MNWLTIAWSMCAAACGMFALMHIFLWIHDRRSMYLLSSLAAAAACANAFSEMLVFDAQTIQEAVLATRAATFAIYLMLVPLVWFTYVYFGVARRWLAIIITALWTGGMVANFVSPAVLCIVKSRKSRRR